MDAADQDLAEDEAFQRHVAAHDPVSNCPLLLGGRTTLLPSGAAAHTAMFKAIEGASRHLHLEYYEFEDVHRDGWTLSDLLVEKLRQGVPVALTYDGAGSDDTPDAVFDKLRNAGAKLLEYAPLNPFRRRFNPLRLNDRDHRKILLVDGQQAFLGGVNMARVYENPESNGPAEDVEKAFWYDAAVQIEGPPVSEIQKLFLAHWDRQRGEWLPWREPPPHLPDAGNDAIRADGSAPRERRQLYFESLKAATSVARSHIMLATGYFVPTHRQWRLLAEAAERGVTVDLILAGYSDIPACVHAARGLYGRLLERGVRIHEMRDGMLHAKVATIDGVWSAIGSSNLDRRSYVYNDEIDAIVLGRDTARDVKAMLSGWIGRAHRVTLEDWKSRSRRERAGEVLSRVWSRYM